MSKESRGSSRWTGFAGINYGGVGDFTSPERPVSTGRDKAERQVPPPSQEPDSDKGKAEEGETE